MLLKHFPAAVRLFGLTGGLKLLVSRRRIRRWLPRWTERLTLRGTSQQFRFRHATTDKYIIADVLLDSQYQCLTRFDDVRTIVDVGANIGTASVFLLRSYPEARIIALEPDPGNFAVLQENLAPYGSRAIAMQRALWHRSEHLAIDRGKFRDGGEWAFQVRSGGDADRLEVQGVTLDELIREHGLTSIDILKVDIEGAERYVFDSSMSDALSSTRRIAIELHDPVCRDVFFRCMSGSSGRVSQHGEVTLWERLEAAASRP